MNIFQPVFDSCLAELGVSWLRLQKKEVLSDSHVFSRHHKLSDISYFPSLSLPNFLYTYFHLSLHLHIRQTLMAPPSLYNAMESTQIERSHFYSCQLIIEETDSCSTRGKRDGGDGGMGGFCWEKAGGEVSQELFYTQIFFFLSRSFRYFCPLVQPWSFFFFSPPSQ